VAELGGFMYAAGGRDDDDTALSSVERYDPAADSWYVQNAPEHGGDEE